MTRSGLSSISAASDVCCHADVPRASFQSDKTGREPETAYDRATGCSRVCICPAAMTHCSTFISRFSKLFMAHLDSEFQKQSDPTLKSLIANQVCVNSSVMNHHRPRVVSRKTGLCHSVHAVSQQVRKGIRILGDRSQHCRMVYIPYLFVRRLTL